MRTQQIILLSGVAVASALAADQAAAPTLFERSPAPNAVDERDLQECSSVAINLLPSLIDVPTADSSLLNFIAGQTQLATATDPCVFPAVTGSMADEYSSWVSELVTWYSSHTADISSLLEACTDVPEVKSQLDSSIPDQVTLCDKLTWASETGSASSDNNSSDASADSATGTNSGNAAPQQTGMAIAAAAMAGLVVVGIN
ncbi:hypothetical protein BKA56DRAFT_348857 [Ilyonectria sp. MPI-CAGE-AT-0026]|nr:hypothetical protein BKA56DRAFT_348857 [Ilyonectria sp. MPI-CAGE-AT-0026]